MFAYGCYDDVQAHAGWGRSRGGKRDHCSQCAYEQSVHKQEPRTDQLQVSTHTPRMTPELYHRTRATVVPNLAARAADDSVAAVDAPAARSVPDHIIQSIIKNIDNVQEEVLMQVKDMTDQNKQDIMTHVAELMQNVTVYLHPADKDDIMKNIEGVGTMVHGLIAQMRKRNMISGDYPDLAHGQARQAFENDAVAVTAARASSAPPGLADDLDDVQMT